MTERFVHSVERGRAPHRVADALQDAWLQGAPAQRPTGAVRWSRWACLHSIVLLALACGGPTERPPPSDTDIALTDLIQYDRMAADGRDVYATGACEEGATQVCRVYLPSHNDVQPCFVGEQLCGGGQWGECESGVLVDANADDTELDPDTLE